MSISSQAPTSISDVDQIKELMTSLSSQAKKPADVLDPMLSAAIRKKNLGHFSASPYELNVVPDGGAPSISGDTATVPVRVHYKAEDGNSLDVSATVQFVRRGGNWYFANYDFMKWPVFLIIVLVLGISAGIAYAATVLVLWRRLTKQKTQGANIVKMFVPFFWPFLFRQTR